MKNRGWVLGACILVVCAVFILAPGLGNLRFNPARPISYAVDVVTPTLLPSLHVEDSTSIWEILFFWLAIMLNLFLVLLILPPELRKKILLQIFRFGVFILGMVLLLRYRLIQLPEFEFAPRTPSEGTAFGPAGTGDPEVFVEPALPPWVAYLISLLLVMILAMGLYLAYQFYLRHRPRPASPLDAIANIARDSLEDLIQGREWGNVIVAAYARMLEAVRTARDVHREQAWTPREFAARLGRQGLPASAVDELTRLFEAARYGGQVADDDARRRAASCLESILQVCRIQA